MRADPTTLATPAMPTVAPYEVAPDTWLIPNLAPTGPDVYRRSTPW
jgi:hypothetical protein